MPAASATPAGAPSATPSLWVIPSEPDGTSWTLIELNGQPPLAGTTITLAFAGGKASGSAGCNHYQGPYPPGPDPADSVIFEITVMGCLVPAGIMEQEQAYVVALQHAASRAQTADRLEFFDAAGKQTLVFKANEP